MFQARLSPPLMPQAPSGQRILSDGQVGQPWGLGRVGSSHGHGGQSTPLARQLVPLPLAGASLDALGCNRWQEEREWASSLLQEVSGEELGGSLGGSLQGRVFFFFFMMGEN